MRYTKQIVYPISLHHMHPKLEIGMLNDDVDKADLKSEIYW
jgi:hypothetical protein